MSIKDIKSEARHKLVLNMHQAIVIYAVEFMLLATLIAFIVLACLCIGGANLAAGIIMLIYGIILVLFAVICIQVVGFATVDFYLASYKCKPYNIRRIGDVLARSGITKILLMSLKRTLLAFLLLLCLIVPGVIYIIRTSMAAHLLIANPKMKASTALSASNKVMSGKTGGYFSLMMSMFGWWLLGLLTVGLGYVFILPYINLCKTVYYKRNLQGDTAVYKVVIQPISPIISSPEATINVRPLREETKQEVPPETVRPIQIDNPIPPIETLGSEDVAEMNAAMRDFGSEPVVPEAPATPEVPEVAIPPVGVKTKTYAPEPAKNDVSTGRHIEDSDIVEIVKPLTTREVDEADVMGKKIGKMFSTSVPKDDRKEQRDYMSMAGGKQSPDDFVTREYEAPGRPAPQPEANENKPQDVAEEPVISDKEFAEFIRTFDLPEQKGEFKPLERTKKSEAEEKPAAAATPVVETATVHVERDAAAQPRPSIVHPARTASRNIDARADRIRREREERLHNRK